MPRESKDNLKKRAGKIIAALKKTYPQASCSLDHRNPLELLVATILSAQCTDKRVNIVTRDLFKKYPTAEAYASSAQEQLESDIRSTGFFRNKASNIRTAAARIVEDFGGKVPETMAGLVSLPGVARKTANVVLSNAFGKDEGIVVDTHVKRLGRRLGLTGQSAPEKIERDLMAVVPKSNWAIFSHLLIHHGRAICVAAKPDCDVCPINKLCPSAFKTPRAPAR